MEGYADKRLCKNEKLLIKAKQGPWKVPGKELNKCVAFDLVEVRVKFNQTTMRRVFTQFLFI